MKSQIANDAVEKQNYGNDTDDVFDVNIVQKF